MASIDLLEELQLNDYYPQKLSFSEAIKLRGESQNGCPKKYGLEIVRKLLMFDSMAVVSVTSEINERLNNTGNKETESQGQCISDGSRPQRRSIARPSRSHNAKPTDRKLHPMDLLVVVMNCCDDFLRQVLVEKMVGNQLSIPILLPSVRNGSYTLLLFALRSLVPELDRTRESSATLTDTLVDIKNPFVSFIRVGDLHRSKSKLVNELLSFNSFNTFFHKDCPNGSAKRLVSNGSIEAAWFQSETEEEFNCRFFTALNLRGNARDYPKQTQFLCQSSTLVVFMVDAFELFKELYENALKDGDVAQTKIIVCNISPTFPDDADEQTLKFLEDLSDRGVIYADIYDWKDGNKMSDVDFANDLRKTISEFSNTEHWCSNQMPTYANVCQKICQTPKNFMFSLDEDKPECIFGKESADEFIGLVLNLPPDCKPVVLPLQGEPWEKIGKLEREQRGNSTNKSQDENFIAEKETEKIRQRKIQCDRLIQLNEIAQTFSLKFHILQDRNLSYYINSCKIKLDARSRVVISNIIKEFEKVKQEHTPQMSEEENREVKLSQIELQIWNSAIGIEHILREHGQMYEAVISEEIRMKEELKNAPLAPDVIRNFPSIVARLLLAGQPLELMDGDASNVTITWLKAILNQVKLMTNNAKVFVFSIIGVQSSGKSTLLNALFGLQFPVSAGRCTKGIYCHLVPVDKGSLIVEFDYVLVVDTEGLGSSEFMEYSIFRDNELATFAIGLADATIINMKGENWSEMKDILQIAAHGLIRVRKTKAELELMPRCMFVHQNVAATDAKEKNRLGQEKQLTLLDKAIKAAGHEEGFTEITKFNQVIWYDPDFHSWYFPDLWNGRPPKASISQDYIGKTNKLREYLINLMKNSPSKLTISGFSYRMSDLWNAMLHNDFVLCFRNTQEIISGTSLNDRISHEVDRLKYVNKLEQTKTRELICSFISVEEFRAEKERILREVSAAVEKNCTKMKVKLQELIDATDICAALKQKYEISLNALKDGELRRINDETTKNISVHMKKLEIGNDQRVKDLKAKMADLEISIEEMEKDKLNETEMKDFDESWQQLIADNNMLVDERKEIVESEINETIRLSINKLSPTDTVQFDVVDWGEIFKMPFVVEMPQVTENDIFQKEETSLGWVLDFVYVKSYVDTANSRLEEARKIWELQFLNLRDFEFDASHLEQVMSETGRLMRILAEEHTEVRPGADEICSSLPPGYSFTRDFIIRFIKFACHYTYNRSLENGQRFISITDPLSDIGERRHKSVSNFQQMSAEANIDAVSKQIFDYARRSFVKDLGELIKTEVCKESRIHPTFKYKRTFLRTILTDLGQRTHDLTQVNEEKEIIFREFMLYVEMAQSEASENFFLDAILKLLKEMLTKEASETDFQKMVENNVGKVVKKAKNALMQADAICKGRAKEYIRIFKEYMDIRNAIDFRVSILDGFTKAVLEKIDNLYTHFLSQANCSFETLVCEDNRAAIRPLFEKIMGCREKCPFCSAPCSQSLGMHAGDHRANHYPTGVSGTVDSSGWLTSIQETKDATKQHMKPRKLVLDTCQTMVSSPINIRTPDTVQKYRKWYHSWFNWNYQSFKNYKDVAVYANWDIPYSGDPKTSLFWKWFMAQFDKELAEHYKALCPVIPEAWKNATWEEAKESLDEPD